MVSKKKEGKTLTKKDVHQLLLMLVLLVIAVLVVVHVVLGYDTDKVLIDGKDVSAIEMLDGGSFVIIADGVRYDVEVKGVLRFNMMDFSNGDNDIFIELEYDLERDWWWESFEPADDGGYRLTRIVKIPKGWS